MNRGIILILLNAATLLTIQAQVITGNVIDGFDRGYLDKVWVVNLSNNDSSLTNERGYFRLIGVPGDSLSFIRSHYIPKKIIVSEETHFIAEIYLNARMLPAFDLYAQKPQFSFNMGNLSNLRPLSDRPAGPGKIYSGLADNQALVPGLTMDGPISYFMKSERQKRQYARKLEFMARQQVYLDVIQSDSIKTALRERFGLKDQELDSLIVEFNLANQYHQFLDMKRESVEKLLLEFFQQYAYRKRH